MNLVDDALGLAGYGRKCACRAYRDSPPVQAFMDLVDKWAGCAARRLGPYEIAAPVVFNAAANRSWIRLWRSFRLEAATTKASDTAGSSEQNVSPSLFLEGLYPQIGEFIAE